MKNIKLKTTTLKFCLLSPVAVPPPAAPLDEFGSNRILKHNPHHLRFTVIYSASKILILITMFILLKLMKCVNCWCWILQEFTFSTVTRRLNVYHLFFRKNEYESQVILWELWKVLTINWRLYVIKMARFYPFKVQKEGSDVRHFLDHRDTIYQNPAPLKTLSSICLDTIIKHPPLVEECSPSLPQELREQMHYGEPPKM